MQAAERLEAGEPFSPYLDAALLRGSSIGGARPKALLDDNGRRLIAKFSSSTDPYPVVKAEAVAMELARRVGINVAGTAVVECLGRDVLLVDRFDRTGVAGERRMMVSALTLLELDEMMARYATYPRWPTSSANDSPNPRKRCVSSSRESCSISSWATPTTTQGTTQRSGTARRCRSHRRMTSVPRLAPAVRRCRQWPWPVTASALVRSLGVKTRRQRISCRPMRRERSLTTNST